MSAIASPMFQVETHTCAMCLREHDAANLKKFGTAHLCGPCRTNLGDPVWRLTSGLYSIMGKDASGENAGAIPFLPTPEQRQIIDGVYVRREEMIVVVKARQLGLSTVVCLIILDALLFGSGIKCSIVDQTAEDAEKKLDEKIKFAFHSLPEWLRQGWEIPLGGDNKNEFIIKLRGKEKDDERSCFAGKRARGGNHHLLFISEWGDIQAKDKPRSLEILTGALPSANHPGCVTIAETTWRGGRTGELWPFVRDALKIEAEGIPRSPKDPVLYFMGWYTGKDNRLSGSPVLVTEKTHEYFDRLEKLTGRKFDDGQKLWWQKEKAKYGVMMGSEYPSTLDEALESAHAQAFFDPVGVKFQESLAIGLEPTIEYGDLILNPDTKAVTFRKIDAGREQFSVFRIWDRPQEGWSYLISVDSRVGRQSIGATGELDCNSCSVWRAAKVDPVTGRTYLAKKVASLMPEDRCGTVELIRRVVALHMWYGGCMVVPEINNKDDIAERMIAGGVTKMWRQDMGEDGATPGTTRREAVFGWCTSSGAGGTRKQMLDHLFELVQQQRFIGSCRTFAHQLSVFIYRGKPGSLPVPSAAEGEHDDTVTEAAIGLFLINHATPYQSIGQQAAAKAGAGNWRDCFTEGEM
jgi:hypothetical protein